MGSPSCRGNWPKTIKPPRVECAVAGCVDCGSHILDASPLWCDYSCLLQSHYSSASRDQSKKARISCRQLRKAARECSSSVERSSWLRKKRCRWPSRACLPASFGMPTDHLLQGFAHMLDHMKVIGHNACMWQHQSHRLAKCRTHIHADCLYPITVTETFEKMADLVFGSSCTHLKHLAPIQIAQNGVIAMPTALEQTRQCPNTVELAKGLSHLSSGCVWRAPPGRLLPGRFAPGVAPPASPLPHG